MSSVYDGTLVLKFFSKNEKYLLHFFAVKTSPIPYWLILVMRFKRKIKKFSLFWPDVKDFKNFNLMSAFNATKTGQFYKKKKLRITFIKSEISSMSIIK